jgi:hypothetical protein
MWATHTVYPVPTGGSVYVLPRSLLPGDGPCAPCVRVYVSTRALFFFLRIYASPLVRSHENDLPARNVCIRTSHVRVGTVAN